MRRRLWSSCVFGALERTSSMQRHVRRRRESRLKSFWYLEGWRPRLIDLLPVSCHWSSSRKRHEIRLGLPAARSAPDLPNLPSTRPGEGTGSPQRRTGFHTADCCHHCLDVNKWHAADGKPRWERRNSIAAGHRRCLHCCLADRSGLWRYK